MAAGSRTLKLSILGDVDQLKKSLNAGSNDVEGFGSKLGDFSKKATMAFAAAGAAAAVYAGKYLVEATKNAAEDEKAQRNLALTLENTTNATRLQISAIEDWISKTALAYGVTDDQLRPAFERLTRSTKDTQKSQELLNLAIQISAATSKPLETITAALAKAYDGNAASLGRLGLGIDSSILKSKDFDKITAALRENFRGFAEQEANTFEGKLRRLQIAFDEGKETIGSYVLDGITPLVTGLVDHVIPAITTFSESIGKTLGPELQNFVKFISTVMEPLLTGLRKGFNYISDAIKENRDEFKSFFEVVQVAAPIIGTVLGKAFEAVGKVASIVLNVISEVLAAIKPLLNTAIDGINLIIKGLNLIKSGPDIGFLGKIGTGSPGSGFSGTRPDGSSFGSSGTGSSGGTSSGTGSSGTGSSGGTSSGSGSSGKGGPAGNNVGIGSFNAGRFREAEARSLGELLGGGLSNFDAGRFRQGEENSMRSPMPPNVNITVNGAIDPIGTARQIANVLNTEATLSGTFNNLGGSRLVAQ